MAAALRRIVPPMVCALALIALSGLLAVGPTDLHGASQTFGEAVRLSTLRPRMVSQGWGTLTYDRSVQNHALQIGDRKFTHGIGTHAYSHLLYLLGGRYERFKAWIGVDAEMKDYPRASVVFQVVADGKQIYESGVMRPETPAERVDLEVSKVGVLRLIVTDAGDGNYADHADWAEAELAADAIKRDVVERRFSKETIRSGGLRFEVRGPLLDGFRLPGGMRIALTASGGIGNSVSGDGFVSASEFSGDFQTYRAARGGLTWNWEMTSRSSKPWTLPVDTVFHYPNTKDVRVWMPWGHTWKWEDPMLPRPFETRTWEYGAFFGRENGLSLPMATVIDKKNKIGVTFIQSPEDVLLDVQISTTKDGEIRFSRAFNRFGGKGTKTAFHMDIVVHEPDVRAALRAIVERYPKYFDPPNKLADEVGGLGAYSGYEGPLEDAKLKKIGFSMNWKASIDFPYMGMFLPPLRPEERWNKFAGGGGGGYTAADEGRFGTTSIRQLADYSTRMKKAGFHVLNYFNVTEFGGNIEIPWKGKEVAGRGSQVAGTEGQGITGRGSQVAETELWRDPNAFLHGRLESAVLKNPNPIWTWGSAVIMDCGDPKYKAFLLDQAKRHIEELPSSDGICIDRMDWLVQYNPHADDGVTWIEGPQQHLRRSWIALMDRMGPIFHKAGKVIFVNDMDRRLELMRHVDGFYDEHGDFPFNLNTSAFLALRKPLVVWTRGNETLKPDPDAYFQRNLYLGAFPTAPLSANDHTIVPDAWNEKLYLDYGPMFRAIKGRKWALEPGVAYVEGGKAKVNVFETPKGRVVFVGLGGKAKNVKVSLKGFATSGNVLWPGGSVAVLIQGKRLRGRTSFDVPLKRGCAMLLFAKAPK